ncbi:histidine kinase [Sphingomonas sp. ID1715]|uniref:sensor histidine kinase n=1 Tax=Sphingomonas sp. ID1715 TaxID=1656898 RepID=UPI0017C2E94E|nr:ATP-binding protein [Sphingomonas sp. ID1715]NNM76425.1 histidine kinase [Sphingomonas sp. ID1715]
MIVMVLAGLMAAAAFTQLAISRPWLGLTFAVHESRAIHVVSAPGMDLTAKQVTAIRGNDGQRVAIEAGDLIEEPDTLATYADMRRFFARQSALAGMLRAQSISIEALDGDTLRQMMVSPARMRPIGDLPAAFWVQMLVGLSSFLIGGWVWALRRDDLPARLFALASLGILVFTFPAALYSTRELAIDGGLFRALSVMNHGGALLFGAAMIALLLRYPRSLVPTRWLCAPFVLFGTWWLADSMQLFDGPLVGSQLPTMLEMIGILLAAALQYWRSRRDPRNRAVVRWFGLSVAIGSGAFVFTVIAPSLVGLTPSLPQGYAFTFFLLIHGGIAVGVARYRLFDLDRWAFRILFYMTGAALLIAVDVLLISWVALDRAPAFGLALVLVAFLYLPLRDMIARKLFQRGGEVKARFQDMLAVALADGETERMARWRDLLTRVFQPLNIVPGDSIAQPTVLDDGAALAIPATGVLPPLRLEHAMHGRRLFSSREQTRAGELCAMLDHAIASRLAHEQGVAEERQRITSDMHDNIGVQLLGALHSRDPVRKDELIRDTLADLREIINNSAGERLTLAELMADLRVEIADLLSSAGIGLVWQMDTAAELPPQSVAAMRSILREAVGNALRHAEASTVGIRLCDTLGGLVLTIADDGKGFDPDTAQAGNGLRNMRSRATALHGTLTVSHGAAMGMRGTVIEVRFPLESVAA